MNTVIDTLNTGFATLERIALTNLALAEYCVAALVVASIWLLISKRRGGFMLLAVSVWISAWLSWKTGHHGMSVQQIVILMFCAYDFFGLTIVVRNKNVK